MTPAPEPPATPQWHNRAIMALTVALFMTPIVLTLAFGGPRYLYAFLSADCMYYLAVAERVLDHGFFTYDFERPVNGFHPLWQGCVVVLAALGRALGLAKTALPALLLGASILAIVPAIMLYARTFILCFRRLSPFFLLLPLGLFGALTFFLHPVYGTLWSYADGMESGLVLLAYALILWQMVRPGFMASATAAVLMGLSLAGLSLARLDHALFLIPFFAAMAIKATRQRNRGLLTRCAYCLATASAILGAYLLLNRVYAGSALPLSGVVKSTFPHIAPNRQILDFASGHVFDAQDAFYRRSVLWRLAQIAGPAIVAAIALITLPWMPRRDRTAPLDFALAVTAAFVLLLAAYNGLYVPLFAQGHWYVPVSVLFVSLVALRLVQARPIRGRWVPLVATAIAVAVAAASTAFASHRLNLGLHDFLAKEAPLAKEHYAGQPLRLVEYDDGLLAYGLACPALSGTRLMADHEAVSRVEGQGESFLDLAHARGFDHLASWGYWPQAKKLTTAHTTDEIIAALKTVPTFFRDWQTLQDKDARLLRLDYQSPSSAFAVIRMLSIDPAYLRAEAAMTAGRWEEAIDAFHEAEDSGAVPRGHFHMALGEACLAAGRFDDARKAYNAASRTNEAIVQRSLRDDFERSYAQRKAQTRLDSIHARLVTLTNDDSVNPDAAPNTGAATPPATIATAEQLLEQGLSALEQGEWAEMKERVGRALILAPQLAPRAAQAAVGAAEERLTQAGTAAARTLYETAHAWDPTANAPSVGLAILPLHEGHIEKAIQQCQALAAARPATRQALAARLLAALTRTNEADQAVAIAQATAELDTAQKTPAAEALMAQATQTAGTDATLRCIRAAIALSPATPAYTATLAKALEQDGRITEAESVYRQGLTQAPAHKPFYAGLDRLYTAKTKDERIALWQGMAAQYPDSAPAHLYLAGALLAANEQDAATTTYRKAGQLAKQDTNLQAAVGQRLFRLGDFEGAVEPLRQATQGPLGRSQSLNELLIQALAKTGKTSEARQVIERCQKNSIPLRQDAISALKAE